MTNLQQINSVFNIEIEKIDPNPNQPRKFFSPESLRDLSESIRRYGVMQPITVTRRETQTEGGISTRYEIIAGERRWRSSILAGMSAIPAIIHSGAESEQERFELSILENLQREDLNPVDKARSFARLSEEFGMKHAEIADKLGKSREYVTNSLRLLVLPDNILDALSAGTISEGHTRPLLSLKDDAQQLQFLFQEIITKKLTVRDTEKQARALSGKASKVSRYTHTTGTALDSEMEDIKTKLAESLGTKVSIDADADGGTVTIDFFTRDDLRKLLQAINTQHTAESTAPAQQAASADTSGSTTAAAHVADIPNPIAPQDKPTQSFDTIPTGDNSSPDYSPIGTSIQKPAQVPDYSTAQPTPIASPDTSTVSQETVIQTESVAHHQAMPQSPVDTDVRTPRTDAPFSTNNMQNNSVVYLDMDIDTTQPAEHTPNRDDTVSDTTTTQTPDVQPATLDNPSVAPDTVPESMLQAGSDFSPQRDSLAQDVQISIDGSDFFPSQTDDQHSSQAPATGQPTAEQSMPQDTPIPAAQPTPQDSSTTGQPLGQNTPNQSEQPQNPSQKYPQGDPYRLDNFSV